MTMKRKKGRRFKPGGVLKWVRSPEYRQQVERDRSKYHRPSEPHQVTRPEGEA